MTRYYLLVVFGDVEPALDGPFPTDVERLAAARKHREENGIDDGLFRLNIDWDARELDVEYFGSVELEDARLTVTV